MSEVQTTSDFESRLDQLKVITLTDGEVWSARDLMPFAGYSKWENWSKAISRAIASVNASGLNAADHFAGVGKMIEIGKGARREVEDVELTRYACYILFQNADGAKPEVAAAQQYFAIKTRAAEVSPRDTPSGAELIALAVIEAQQMLARKDAEIAQLEVRAAVADRFENSHGLKVTRFVQKYFPDYSRDQIFAFFYDSKQWLVNNPRGRWSARQKKYIAGIDHQQPKNGGGRFFHMPEEEDRNGKLRFKLRVRRDTEHELVAELERHGFRPVLASQFSNDIIPAA